MSLDLVIEAGSVKGKGKENVKGNESVKGSEKENVKGKSGKENVREKGKGNVKGKSETVIETGKRRVKAPKNC